MLVYRSVTIVHQPWRYLTINQVFSMDTRFTIVQSYISHLIFCSSHLLLSCHKLRTVPHLNLVNFILNIIQQECTYPCNYIYMHMAWCMYYVCWFPRSATDHISKTDGWVTNQNPIQTKILFWISNDHQCSKIAMLFGGKRPENYYSMP